MRSTPASRRAASDGRLGLHQHGYDHTNHETEGKKQEFGPARPADAHRRDIQTGRDRLRDLLGDAFDPIFTPPWNPSIRLDGETSRCTIPSGCPVADRKL